MINQNEQTIKQQVNIRPNGNLETLNFAIQYNESVAFKNKSLLPGFNKSAYSVSFRPMTKTPSELIDHITAGKAFSVARFKSNRRIKSEFISSQMLWLDLDNNVSVEHALNHPFVSQYAFFVGATASDSPECRKTRVGFILDKPVTNADEYEKLLDSLVAHCIGLNPDTACTDAPRFFYGSTRDDYRVFDRMLPLATITQVADELASAKASRKVEIPKVRKVTPSKDHIEAYVNKAVEVSLHELANATKGKRNQVLHWKAVRLFEFVGAGILDEARFVYDLRSIGLDIGLSDIEVDSTIASGREKGLKNPFDVSKIKSFGKSTTPKTAPDSSSKYSHKRFPKIYERVINRITQNLIFDDSGNVQCPFCDGTGAGFSKRNGSIHCKECRRSQFHSMLSVARHLKIDVPIEGRIDNQSIAHFGADYEVIMRYISDADLKHVLYKSNGCLVRSPIGTGKTELVVRTIEYLKQFTDARVLFITHSENLANQTASRFSRAGINFESYQMNRNFIPSVDKLAICYNSLYKLFTGDNQPHFDLIVIDEINQFLRHTFGGTFSKNEAPINYEALQYLVRDCGYFMGLDAHADDISYAWIKKLRDGHIMKIRNDYRAEKGDLHIHRNYAPVIARAVSVADQNPDGTVAIVTNSKRKTDEYYQLFSAKYGAENVALINSWTSNEPTSKAIIENPSENVSKYRVIISSPSMITGVDIQSEVLGVYGIVMNEPNTATDAMQMIGRYRNAGERHVWIQGARKRLKTDVSAIYNQHKRNAQRTAKDANFGTFGIDAIPEFQLEMLGLYARVEATDNVQRNDKLSWFVAYAEHEGYDLHFHNEDDTGMREILSEVSATFKQIERENILTVEPVDYAEFRQHETNGTLTPELRYGHEKYKMQGFSETITDENYDDLRKSSDRRNLMSLADMLLDNETLATHDRDEFNDMTMLMKSSHKLATQKLIMEILSLVFGKDGYLSKVEMLESDIVRSLSLFITIHEQDIQDLLDKRGDMSLDPIFVLRRVLKRIGMKLQSEQRMKNGVRKRWYSICPETRSRAFAYANHYNQQREQRENERLLKTRNLANRFTHVLSNPIFQRLSEHRKPEPIPEIGNPDRDIA